MSKFITGKDLEDAVYDIIWKAEAELLIVSPYISLGEYFKSLFQKHRNNPKLQITIVFGKNEGQINKSFNKTDFEFFKEFLNISIVYVPNLHGKYYANENMGVLTSINLYDYSFKNNIEFGVIYENKFINRLSKNTDFEAWDICQEIAEDNEVVYIKRPIFQKKLFGKDYISSKVLYDRTDELYSSKSFSEGEFSLSYFDDELDYKVEYGERPTRQDEKLELDIVEPQTISKSIEHIFEPGFCIRTGEKINFNPERPLSYQAYKTWSQYGDENFPEKFCHYSGEPSNGETCVKKPVLRKNWKKSQEALV